MDNPVKPPFINPYKGCKTPTHNVNFDPPQDVFLRVRSVLILHTDVSTALALFFNAIDQHITQHGLTIADRDNFIRTLTERLAEGFPDRKTSDGNVGRRAKKLHPAGPAARSS